MGKPEIEVPNHQFIFGGDPEHLCRECQLPCQHETTSMDCFRRFFLQTDIHCTYFVHGYCFLVDKPGCVFDNGGEHDTYWMNLLNQYFHDVADTESSDDNFVENVQRLNDMIDEHINTKQVSLCRYLEEVYNRAMGTGGGLGADMMERLDEAYMALLSGTPRKR